MDIRQRKSNHALQILSNLEGMQERGIICDFEIRVEGKSLSAHRAILMASSRFFEELFTSDAKANKKGHITFRGVTFEGMKLCLEYIYTAEINITSENIRSIFDGAHLLKLDAVVEICVHCLRKEQNVDTALLAVSLFRLYGTKEEEKNSEKFVVENFTTIIQTKEFLNVDKNDLILYLKSSNFDCETHWDTILVWMWHESKDKEPYLPDLLSNFLEINKDVSVKYLIKKIWDDSFIQNSGPSKALIFKTLLERKDTLEKELDLELCYNLKEILRKHKFPAAHQLHTILNQFLAENFQESSSKEEFLKLSREDLTAILTSQKLQSETEWEKKQVLQKWSKQSKTREKQIPGLQKLLNQTKMLIESQRHHEKSSLPPIKPQRRLHKHDSPEIAPKFLPPTKDATMVQEQTLTLVALDHSSGIMTALDVKEGTHKQITKIEKKAFMKIISLQGELYLFRDEDLYKFSSTGIWEKKASVKTCSKVVTFNEKLWSIEKDVMFSYDPVENTWTDGLPGCKLGAAFCITASDYWIYALGGYQTLRQARRYDRESKTWLDMPAMITGRLGATAAVCHSCLYVMGGHMESASLNSVEYYTPANNGWIAIEKMKKPREWFSAVVLEDKIYVIGGGRDENGKILKEDYVEVFDNDTKKFDVLCKMPKSEGRISACVYETRIAKPQS